MFLKCILAAIISIFFTCCQASILEEFDPELTPERVFLLKKQAEETKRICLELENQTNRPLLVKVEYAFAAGICFQEILPTATTPEFSLRRREACLFLSSEEKIEDYSIISVFVNEVPVFNREDGNSIAIVQANPIHKAILTMKEPTRISMLGEYAFINIVQKQQQAQDITGDNENPPLVFQYKLRTNPFAYVGV